MWVQKNVGPQNILDPKRFLVHKNVGYKKIRVWVKNNSVSKRIFGLKNWVKKKMVPKNFGVKKVGAKRFFGFKNWVEK